MITLGGGATKIHLATEPIDLRRGYGGHYDVAPSETGSESSLLRTVYEVSGRTLTVRL